MKKTLFIDIDGTLFKHKENLSNILLEDSELLPGVIEKLNQWNADGHIIILTTGRTESMRKITEKQLQKNGIFYNQLIMGLTRGERIIINDIKPNNNMITASAIQINRNEGLININLKKDY